jgi:ABC-type protease/lipase transport system fused ATPase/permease subunit
MVTQDTSLLHRSIQDNIRYGRPEAGEAEVREAAARAHALEFIERLEDWHGRRGFDAHVGERGVKLSGGQRQRIAIARVILKNAPILVLDEATSALDSEVEAAIQEQLEGLMRGRTVIAIAHRLSTISRLDRLIVRAYGGGNPAGSMDRKSPPVATRSRRGTDTANSGARRAERRVLLSRLPASLRRRAARPHEWGLRPSGRCRARRCRSLSVPSGPG